jgi:hypothetical protein
MPRIADYTVVRGTDGGFTLPDPASDVNDRHFQDIDAPGVSSGENAVLIFRVNPDGDPVTLQVRLNNTVVLRQTFDTEPQRSWHELVPAGALKAENNELTVSIDTSNPQHGSVQLSDFVFLYQREVGPVIA